MFASVAAALAAMQTFQIEPLESRIAPATVLTSAVFTSESTIISGTYDGGVDATIEVFAQPIGGAPVSLGTLNYFAADGPVFTAFAPVLEPGTSVAVIVTPLGGIADAPAGPMGATRGLWAEDLEVLESGASQVVNFTVHLSLPSALPVSVVYTTTAGTATAGQDFAATSGTINFAPGETVKTVAVTLLGDTVSEGGEAFELQLSESVGALVADSTASCVIRDDDASSSGAVGVYFVPLTVTEGGTAMMELRLTRAAGVSVNVDLATSDGSALGSSDFTSTTGTITFAPGQTSQTFAIPILNDTTFEGRERLLVNVQSATPGLEVLFQTGVVTVLDNDAPTGPLVTIADVSLAEGTSASPTSYTITVALSAPAVEAITLRVATGDGTARSTDYQGGTGTLTFEIGESVGSISLPVRADDFLETNETFFFALDQVTGAVASDTFAVCTITNDDTGLPVLEITDATPVTETDASGVSAQFTITLSVASATAVSVNVFSDLGTAVGGLDYTPASGTLTFAPGETVKNLTIAITGDLSYESTETFGVNLSSPTGARIADTVGVGTILDNDPVNTAIPQLRILDSQFLEGTGQNRTANVIIALDHAAPAPITVQLRYRNGLAVVGSDIGNPTLTVTIPAGANSGLSSFVIAGDFALEPDEFFYVDVLSATASTVVDNRARITLINDDSGPDISEDQKTAHWRDVDGDLITLTASKGILTTANFAMLPVTGGLVLGALFFDTPDAAGLSFTVSAKGSGKSIQMGGIIATGIDLGAVKVQGDIARIVAGSGGKALAVAKLDLLSIGAQGSANDLSNSSLSELTGRLGTVNILGNIGSATISINSGTAPSIASLKVGGQIKGGSTDGAGYIFATGDIASIAIRGDLEGGAGFYSGSIQTLGSIGKLTIGGSIKGGAGSRSGGIFAHGFHTPAAPGIASIAIAGSIIGGSGAGAGALYSYGAVGSLKVGGDILNGFIATGGIAKLTVGRDVSGTQIVSGVTVAGTGFANSTASVAPAGRATKGFGSVTVGRNWIASSLAADIQPDVGGMYGTAENRLLYANTVAAIQSVNIKGTVSGSSALNDTFGFVARTIVAFHAANASPSLNLSSVDVLTIGAGTDVKLREVITAA